MEVHHIQGDVEAAVDQLRAALGDEAMVVGADCVWLLPSRPDRSTRVVDRASRRVAEEQIYEDASRTRIGLIDRLVNRRMSALLTRLVLAHLPVAPVMLTLLSGFIGVYGALMITTGTWLNVVLGFAVVEASVLVDGCATEVSRIKMYQTPLGAWLDALVGDFVNIVLILAVGVALWRRGGTFMDMKVALVSAGLTLLYAVVSYRELVRQGESDVMKLRWWFSYGQSLLSISGAGASQLKGLMLLGRRDVLVVLGVVLAYYDQLPVVAHLHADRRAGARHRRDRPAADARVANPPARLTAASSVVLAVDGLDGSGKSRLASSLVDVLTSRGQAPNMLHVDDFRRPVDFAGLDAGAEAALYYERYYDFAALQAELAARARAGEPTVIEGVMLLRAGLPPEAC